MVYTGSLTQNDTGSNMVGMPARPQPAHMTPAELRQRLDAHRVTQGEAAARLGITRQTLVRWLGGKTPINRANANLVRLTFPKQ